MMRSRGEKKTSNTATKHFAMMENSGSGIDFYCKYAERAIVKEQKLGKRDWEKTL